MHAEEAMAAFFEHLHLNERSPKTVIGYQSDLRHFQRFYESRHNTPWYVDETLRIDIDAFLHHLKIDQKLQAATRNRFLFCLRSFFQFLLRHDMISQDPVLNVEPIRIHRRERIPIPAVELERYLQGIQHPIVYPAAMTIFYTGVRISECVRLAMGDVNFAKRQILVRQGKGNKDRVLPMSDKLYSILKTYVQTYRLSANRSERLFATLSTGQLSPSQFTRVMHQTEKIAGWPRPITAHLIRHSFATQLVQKGVNLVQVQKLLGHSSLSVTSIYTHAQMDELTEAVNRL